MADLHALSEGLRDFARALVRCEDDHIEVVLDELCRLAVAVLPVTGAGITLAEDDGRLHVAAATDETVHHLETLQELGQEGPCRDAYRTGKPVVVADLADCDAWPTFVHGALAAGLAGVAGIPMWVNDNQVGALTLYSDVPLATLPAEDLEAGQTLAAMATAYVLDRRRHVRSARRGDQLRHALDSRLVLAHATGIIAARHHLPLEDAFDRLRTHARDHNRRIHDVAHEIVRGTVEV